MIRILALISGLLGAGTLSQAPEFTQQYYQRLSGAVDALRPIALTFDVAARTQGLSREEALSKIGGNDFADALRVDLAGSVARYDRLSAAEARISQATPLQRLAQPWSFADPELFDATLSDYRPALPLTQAGLISGVIGFAIGYLLVNSLLGALRRLVFPRRLA